MKPLLPLPAKLERRTAGETERPELRGLLGEARVQTAWLPGRALAAVFVRPGGGFLLFTTDSIPGEEGLHAALLDEAGGLIDQRTLAQKSNTGRLRDLKVDGPFTVSFSFFLGDRWRVTVPEGRELKPRPRWRPRFLGSPLKVKRGRRSAEA